MSQFRPRCVPLGLGAACLLAAAAAPVEAAELTRFEARQRHMGTQFGLVVYAAGEDQAKTAMRAAFEEIAALDARLSDYAPDSELSRLSGRAPTPAAVPVSEVLFDVLRQAEQFSCRSDGAFDVTVGPLTRLWRRARRRREMPEPDYLQAAREAVGYKALRLHPESRSVELLRPGMRLDLGGIAKGYAADAAMRRLRDHGITRALINAGGDLRVGAPPPGERGWRIAVAPLEKQGDVSHELLLAEAAVATSGDTSQYVEIDGRRYSHLVDPATGLGLTLRSSVTVVAPQGTSADALASAVSVLGPRRGLRLIEETPHTEALVVWRDGERQRAARSSRFARYLAPDGNPQR